jgi:transposase
MATIIKQSIGIDIAKDKFDVCFSVLDASGRVVVKSSRSFANHKSGFVTFDQWVVKWQTSGVELCFTMEATGVYYENLAWHLHQQDRQVSVVLPNLAKKYLQSLGYKSKNDKIDAKGLAQMGAERKLQQWQPLSKQLYLLRKLTREHEQINKTKTSIKNLLHVEEYAMISGKSTVKRLEKTLQLFQQQLLAIEKELQAADQLLAAKVANITSIKGVGFLTAVTIIAETNGFELFQNQRQLVSYAGYDVVENQSGTRTGKTRISKKGNSHIRRCLFMPAFNMVRYELPVFKELHERLVAKGRTKMQAYVALQKKLLALIYTLWRKDEKYEPTKINILNQEAEAPLLGCCIAAG